MPLLQSLWIYNFMRTLLKLMEVHLNLYTHEQKYIEDQYLSPEKVNNYWWMETVSQYSNTSWLPSSLFIKLHAHFLIKAINPLLSLSLKILLSVALTTMHAFKCKFSNSKTGATNQMSFFKKTFLQGISIIKSQNISRSYQNMY